MIQMTLWWETLSSSESKHVLTLNLELAIMETRLYTGCTMSNITNRINSITITSSKYSHYITILYKILHSCCSPNRLSFTCCRRIRFLIRRFSKIIWKETFISSRMSIHHSIWCNRRVCNSEFYQKGKRSLIYMVNCRSSSSRYRSCTI